LIAARGLGPGATIGVLGGGQLGRMMAVVARQMGYRIIVLDPSPRCPTAQVSDGVVVGALDDVEAAKHLAGQVDVITLDTEHVPADVLRVVEAIAPVRPNAAVLRTIQDRLVQKQFLDRIGLPQAAWAPADDVHAALAKVGRPAILKVRRAGYDGKGQVRIAPSDDPEVLLGRLRGEPAVAEEVVAFTREISVILARGLDGQIQIYPVAENVHRNHILHTTRAPAPMPDARRRQAEAMAVSVAEALEHVGVMAVEMFELADGRLLVNEIAPRTHNSGHYTYGASATSQFEQHIRAVCGVPLGDPRLLTGAVMVNLIGDLWGAGNAGSPGEQGGQAGQGTQRAQRALVPPAWGEILARPEARLHLYGKDAPTPGRKMGHVLLLDDDTERALVTAESLIATLRSRS